MIVVMLRCSGRTPTRTPTATSTATPTVTPTPLHFLTSLAQHLQPHGQFESQLYRATIGVAQCWHGHACLFGRVEYLLG